MSVTTRSNRRRRGAALAAVLVVCSASAAGAAGSSSQAGREFERGAAAAARGDYLDAAAAFHRAYKLAPHAAPLYNAALAWEAAGDRPRAADAYWTAIDMGGLADAQERDARRRLAALDARLGVVEVTGPSGTTVSMAHAERAKVPARIRVEPGEHALRAWFADGRGVLRKVTVRAGSVELHLEPDQKEQPAPAPVAPQPPADRDSGSVTRTLGWTALGAGVVIGGVTAYLGVQALQARGEYYDSGRTDRDAYDRAGSYRTWTNVALGVSVVAGAAGLVLLLKSSPPSQDPAAASRFSPTVSLRPGPGSLWLDASF